MSERLPVRVSTRLLHWRQQVRWFGVAAMLSAGCDPTTTRVDPGVLCVGERAWQSDVDLTVGQPIPLVIGVPMNCRQAAVASECRVDIEGNEVIVSSVVDISPRTQRLRRGQAFCASVFDLQCDMPPAPEGVTVVRYGASVMALTVPSTHTQCIEATPSSSPD